ncbi:hypothetical protein BUH_4981 [Burkholderia pseudomallei Pakistan 9]|nr:hypothetical protein BUH_4981 [Burkholderia pseudomallei Pakistan 9]
MPHAASATSPARRATHRSRRRRGRRGWATSTAAAPHPLTHAVNPA